jgi:osmoprotectant transport system substrate-binding protein
MAVSNGWRSAGIRKYFCDGCSEGRRRAGTLSAAAKARAWKLGAGYEFAHREDGLPGLLKTYGLRMSGTPKAMDLGLLYQALSKHQVDMVAGNSTDGMLAILPVTVLEDDRHYFPPYECALVVREGG